PIQDWWPMSRSAATTPTSVPVSTIVAATQAASTAATAGVTQLRPCGPRSAGSVSAVSERSGGFASQTSAPPAIEANSQLNNAHDVDQYVASSTPSAGPIMNEISMTTASIDSAEVRCASG